MWFFLQPNVSAVLWKCNQPLCKNSHPGNVGLFSRHDSDSHIHCLPPYNFANCLNVYPKAINLNKASSRIINENNMQNKVWLTNLIFFMRYKAMLQRSKRVWEGARVHVCVEVPPNGRTVSLSRVLKLDERDHLRKWSMFDHTTRQKWPLNEVLPAIFFYDPRAINSWDCSLIDFAG